MAMKLALRDDQGQTLILISSPTAHIWTSEIRPEFDLP